ncbi:MAG: hypothetical protein K6F39_09405 [Lachnospiraceae bacterium]|nr:hypothetical protein [Lachnospiraceae bacterium]
MAVATWIRSEYSSYTIGVGEELNLKFFDADEKVISNRALQFKVNDSRIIRQTAGKVTGKTVGSTSIVIQNKSGDVTRVKVRVVPTSGKFYSKAGLPMYILDEDRESFYKAKIFTCHNMIDKIDSKIIEASNMDINRKRLYVREAALFEMSGIDRNFVLLAALAGIRNIYDLSLVDAKKALSVFEIVAPMAKMFDGEDKFTYPATDTILKTIEAANNLKSFSSKYARFTYGDDEPAYLLNYDKKKIKTDTDVICEALEFLQNISIALPLPKTISGRVVMRKRDEDLEDAEPQMGYKVTLTGIANPSSDKSEDDEDLHAYTDNDGKFVIVMPEKYNMQETVKFKVSVDESRNRVGTVETGSNVNSAKEAVFIKRASEIMKAVRIEYFTWVPNDNAEKPEEEGKWEYKSIPAMELLEKLDRLQYSNSRAKELEDALYSRALAEYDRVQLEEQIGRLSAMSSKHFKDICEELSYHAYEKDKEIIEAKDKLKKLQKNLKNFVNRQVTKDKKAVEKLLNDEKNSENTSDSKDDAESQAKRRLMDQRLSKLEKLEAELEKKDDSLLVGIIRIKDEDEETEPEQKELISQIESDTGLESKVKDYRKEGRELLEHIKELEEQKALLESLVKYAKEQIKNNEEAEASDSEDSEEFPSELEDEHDGKNAIDEGKSFDEYLSELYTGLLENCRFYRGKYEEYKKIEKELTEKRNQYEKLTEKKEEITREDIFKQYCEDHSEDKEIIEYRDLNEKANELYYEIQDIDNTVGAKNVKDFRIVNRGGGNYNDITDSSSFQETISSILSTVLDAYFSDPFVLIEENFLGVDLKPRALPTVRLMGEGNKEVELPTDTAPSRVFNYSILQRLVEPSVTKNGIDFDRVKIVNPIDVMDFKENLYNVEENVPIASSLGIGYVLNMHQAWIPDGFALGTLLYSMILAPGEEQRVVVREHAEKYEVSDDASAMDTIRDEYINDQIDHETAAFEQGVLRASEANSDYSYSASASSVGASVSGGWGAIGGSISASHSKNSGKGNASAAQNDSYDEVSSAAQNFQTAIKTQSERLASAKRLSVRTATSSESEAISSKIVANHNHSHVMTVQYWEVARRYKMETSIDGIDLVLFVPLKPVSFLPDKSNIPVSEGDDNTDYSKFSELNFSLENISDFNKKAFNYRYHSFLRYADVLENYLPRRYRGGLELIKKFSACPKWIATDSSSETKVLQLKLVGYFLECDDITATLHFNKSSETIEGELEAGDYLTVDPSMNTRKDVIYAMKKLRTGYSVAKDVDILRSFDVKFPGKNRTITWRTSLDGYIVNKVEEVPSMIYTFYLPAYLSRDDISYISIENNLTEYSFTLSQDPAYLQNHEWAAIENYEKQKWYFAKDDSSSGKDLKRMAHYREALPECYAEQIQKFTRSDLISLGGTKIAAYFSDGRTFTENIDEEKVVESGAEDTEVKGGGTGTVSTVVTTLKVSEPYEKVALSCNKLLAKPIRVDVSSHVPVLGYDEVTRIEETFRHVTTNTMRYSLAVWHSLSEMERIMMLEQYTVDLDYGKITGDNKVSEEEVKIPLLNCINVKKPLGFYGNSILFPFTYPKKLADKLGKTAGDIQDELYRYHTTNFRVPSTSISVPTNGMIGEAVLGRTNVSEKIDITRFWNWKDSDIDHIDLNQNALNGHSLLDNADTHWVEAPTQGVAPTAHIEGSGLLNSLTSRQQPQFADALANTDIRELLQNADKNASAGREQVVKSNTDMTKSALTAATNIAKAEAESKKAAASRVGDTDNIKKALKDMGVSDGDIENICKKIDSGEASFSDVLTSIKDSGAKSTVGTGGAAGSPDGSDECEDKKKDDSKGDASFAEIINYALDAIESGLTPGEMFNKWVKEKKGTDMNYSDAEIKQIADEYCKENGTTMEEVSNAINELCREEAAAEPAPEPVEASEPAVEEKTSETTEPAQ